MGCIVGFGLYTKPVHGVDADLDRKEFTKYEFGFMCTMWNQVGVHNEPTQTRSIPAPSKGYNIGHV